MAPGAQPQSRLGLGQGNYEASAPEGALPALLSHLPFVDLDLLNSLPLVFPHREALYRDDWSSGGALEEELGGEFRGIHDLELPDEAVQVGDWIYTTTLHSPPFTTEIWASQTTFQQLAQAFAANSVPWVFQDIMPPYLHVFENVFSKASFDLLLECKHCKVYPLAPKKQDKLDTFLQRAFLVFFIKKKNSLLQLVQDYWVLNIMTLKNCYPLLLISKLINNLQGVQYFTKLDVWWGYNNVHIQEKDKWKAAFQTNWELFEPLIMSFRLTYSPATFQTMMNNIFWDLIAKGVVCIYLNNILIYTRMLSEHHQITCLILEHLCHHQLYLKLEKCEFKQTQIKYLGLIILHGAVEMDPVTVAGVAEWAEPKNKKEVQAFLGFANFYWRFIQDFLHHACPLFDYTAKDTAWSWGLPEQMAFDALKHTVTSKPVLLFPDNNSSF
ncbi:hypothetical protein E4T56_gene1458 [Termitomyces sp. T112]|nr:hypothetical protein E4T56_gene1458 [Termitomyces sp. T112]